MKNISNIIFFALVLFAMIIIGQFKSCISSPPITHREESRYHCDCDSKYPNKQGGEYQRCLEKCVKPMAENLIEMMK